MTAYSAWLDHILPRVPGATSPIVLQAVRDATTEFCRRTRIYTHELAPIDIVGDLHTYTVTPPEHTVVADFMRVHVAGKKIDPYTEDDMDIVVRWWDQGARGPAEAYLVPANNQIRIVPIPAETIAGGLVAKVALCPLNTSTECPDFLFDDYREAIQCGALAELYMMPRMRWSNGALAQKNEADFNSWCGAGDVRAAQGRTRTRLRVRTRYAL